MLRIVARRCVPRARKQQEIDIDADVRSDSVRHAGHGGGKRPDADPTNRVQRVRSH